MIPDFYKRTIVMVFLLV